MRLSVVVLGLAFAGAVLAQEGPAGDPEHGKAVFEGAGGCLACHRVFDKGSRLGGPDLSEVGSRRGAEELRQAIVAPMAEAQPQNKGYRVVLRDGSVVTGKLLNQDQFSLQMLDSKERLVSFQKSNLREYAFVAPAAMPAYGDKLSATDLADVVSYLASLKGVVRH